MGHDHSLPGIVGQRSSRGQWDLEWGHFYLNTNPAEWTAKFSENFILWTSHHLCLYVETGVTAVLLFCCSTAMQYLLSRQQWHCIHNSFYGPLSSTTTVWHKCVNSQKPTYVICSFSALHTTYSGSDRTNNSLVHARTHHAKCLNMQWCGIDAAITSIRTKK